MISRANTSAKAATTSESSSCGGSLPSCPTTSAGAPISSTRCTGEAISSRRRRRPTPPLPFRLAILACDHAAAAELGEQVLRVTRDYESLEALRWPIFVEEFDLTYGGDAFHRASLAALERLIERSPKSPWGYYYRGIFMSSL